MKKGVSKDLSLGQQERDWLTSGVCSKDNKHKTFDGVFIKNIKDLNGWQEPLSIREIVRKLSKTIIEVSVVSVRNRIPLHNHVEGEIYFSPDKPCCVIYAGKRLWLEVGEFIVITGNVPHGIFAPSGVTLFSAKFK